MATKVIKYPLDKTGKSTGNLVLAEPHVVPRDNSRAFATFYGPYYTDSLVVRQKGNVTPLKKGVDYKPIMLYQDATLLLGLSVSAAIIITNKSLGSDFEIDYQVVGGPFSLSSNAVADLFEALELDNRKVAWADVLGKPVRFPPAPHLHDADDLYGMEFVTEALENLRIAILTGDVASHEQIYDYIDRVKDLIYIDIDKVNGRIDVTVQDIAKLRADLQALIDGDIADLKRRLAAHIADVDNPHQTTKAQVGLGDVQNFPPSTDANSIDENDRQTYITPGSMWYALKLRILSVINAHIADTGNPHQTTKAQVGLSDVPNYPMATQSEAEDGTSNERFMSPLRAMQLIAAKVMPALNKHIQDTDNPHKTTAAQTGAVPITRKINGQVLDQDLWIGGVLPGMIALWYTDNIPSGWLLCNGGSVGNNPVLRSLIGDNVPDLRGVFPRGKDNGRGLDPDSGRGIGSYQDDAMQRMTGRFVVDSNSWVGEGVFWLSGGAGRQSASGAGSATYCRFDNARQVRTATENRPKNTAVNFIIAGDNATTRL